MNNNIYNQLIMFTTCESKSTEAVNPTDKKALLSYACRNYCHRPNYKVPLSLENPNKHGQTKLADINIPLGSMWQDATPSHRFLCLHYKFVIVQTQNSKGIKSETIYFIPRDRELPHDIFSREKLILMDEHENDMDVKLTKEWLEKNAEISVPAEYMIVMLDENHTQTREMLPVV